MLYSHAILSFVGLSFLEYFVPDGIKAYLPLFIVSKVAYLYEITIIFLFLHFLANPECRPSWLQFGPDPVEHPKNSNNNDDDDDDYYYYTCGEFWFITGLALLVLGVVSFRREELPTRHFVPLVISFAILENWLEGGDWLEHFREVLNYPFTMTEDLPTEEPEVKDGDKKTSDEKEKKKKASETEKDTLGSKHVLPECGTLFTAEPQEMKDGEMKHDETGGDESGNDKLKDDEREDDGNKGDKSKKELDTEMEESGLGNRESSVTGKRKRGSKDTEEMEAKIKNVYKAYLEVHEKEKEKEKKRMEAEKQKQEQANKLKDTSVLGSPDSKDFDALLNKTHYLQDIRGSRIGITKEEPEERPQRQEPYKIPINRPDKQVVGLLSRTPIKNEPIKIEEKENTIQKRVSIQGTREPRNWNSKEEPEERPQRQVRHQFLNDKLDRYAAEVRNWNLKKESEERPQRQERLEFLNDRLDRYAAGVFGRLRINNEGIKVGAKENIVQKSVSMQDARESRNGISKEEPKERPQKMELCQSEIDRLEKRLNSMKDIRATLIEREEERKRAEVAARDWESDSDSDMPQLTPASTEELDVDEGGKLDKRAEFIKQFTQWR